MKRAALAALALAAAPLAGPARAFDPDEDRPLRITSEAGFGILGGVGGALTGGLLGYGVCAIGGADHGDFACLLHVVVGGMIGEFAGIGLGAYGGGSLAGGDGGLGWTFLGEAGGALLAGGTVALTEADVGDLGWYFLVSLVPLTGAILGYELSTHATHATGSASPHTVGGSWMFRF